MTYPIQFRKKVLKIKASQKLSFVEVANRFGLSKTTVFKWSKKLAPQNNRVKGPIKINIEALKRDIAEHPDSYCHERALRLGASRTGIRDAQYRLGVSYKKNSKSSQSGSRKKIYILPKD